MCCKIAFFLHSFLRTDDVQRGHYYGNTFFATSISELSRDIFPCPIKKESPVYRQILSSIVHYRHFLSTFVKYCPKLSERMSHRVKYCPKLSERMSHRIKFCPPLSECVSHGVKYCPKLSVCVSHRVKYCPMYDVVH